MTNEEKITNVLRGYSYRGSLTPQGVYGFVFDRCKDIAKWKDQQFEEEKKELRGLVRMLLVNETNQTNQTIIDDLTKLLS